MRAIPPDGNEDDRMRYYAEGVCSFPQKYTKESLLCAMHTGAILESRALSYDSAGNLHFKLGGFDALMPHCECADGVEEGRVHEVALMTRVGRAVCFVITAVCMNAPEPYFLLSRAQAQRRCAQEYLNAFIPGDVLRCRITHLEPFGAFCDVGCGIAALLPIDCLSVSRIASPADRVRVGQDLPCIVKARDAQNRLVLSLKELYGSWQENAALFSAGDTVVGIVRSTEPYGVFVELRPNLAGLAETELNFARGQAVSVYIKSILPDKMKIKLVILHALDAESAPCVLPAVPNFTHLDHWIYSTPQASRVLETVFE
ncbi:MAG: S1 RNA-binding domain-containing protein [Ruthenibacterium sp.]